MKTRLKRFASAIFALLMILGVSGIGFVANADSDTFMFDDVTEADWYFTAVYHCYNKGIFTGVSSTSFAPQKKITRAEFVRVLANYSGDDFEGEVCSDFIDVDDGAWYYSAVAWAKNKNITVGTSYNKFSPYKVITRQELCSLLNRFIAYCGIDAALENDEVFADDSNIALWAKDSVYIIKSLGIVSGVGNNRFNPTGVASRAEAAQMMMKFDQYISEDELMKGINLERIDIEIPGVIKEFSFMHISDSHLTLWDEDDEDKAKSEMIRRGQMFDAQVGDGVPREDKLAQMYDIAEKEKVDAVLLSGDIIDAPSIGNMKRFSEIVTDSSVPSIYCLGNHDWTFEDPYQTERWKYIDGFREIFGNTDENWWEDMTAVTRFDGFALVSVDNSNNQVPTSALSTLKQMAKTSTPVILMLHVPLSVETAVADVSAMWGRDIGLGADNLAPSAVTKAFVDYLKSADSPVVAIIAGHTHLSHIDDVSADNDTVQYTLGASFEGFTRIFNVKGK